MKILERDGYLNRRPDVARGIELLDSDGQPVSNAPRVHIVGAIAAGQPLPAFSTEDSASSASFDTIAVSPDLPRRHGSLYALALQGTSLIAALIAARALFIITPPNYADAG